MVEMAVYMTRDSRIVAIDGSTTFLWFRSCCWRLLLSGKGLVPQYKDKSLLLWADSILD